jgi:hypothetical protein
MRLIINQNKCRLKQIRLNSFLAKFLKYKKSNKNKNLFNICLNKYSIAKIKYIKFIKIYMGIKISHHKL